MSEAGKINKLQNEFYVLNKEIAMDLNEKVSSWGNEFLDNSRKSQLYEL